MCGGMLWSYVRMSVECKRNDDEDIYATNETPSSDITSILRHIARVFTYLDGVQCLAIYINV